ncbi:FlgN protein [Caloramator fervidus]|uniref:FlgN protein n=1 Tax=Caloramator fervidus TaxID=29344 RepID=A0A1H5WK79_9CLOT|nr:flagellar protein FlgN [Caloramator fervidus]SEF99902.1 FlgN protein [Caloramator fervidus]
MMEAKDIIFKLLDVLKEYNKLLDIEKEALLKDDGKAIAKLLEKKREIALVLSSLEKKRQEILGEKRLDDLVNEKIISEDIARNLKEIVDIVKEKNETNAILTKQSLSYIRMMNNLLSPSQNVVYKKSGKVDSSPQNNIFNATI